MEKNPETAVGETSMNRREALSVIGKAVMILGLTIASETTAAPPKEKFIDFEELPQKENTVYLLLFENNSNRYTSDEFIIDASEVMGYTAPHYWHCEVAYFDKTKKQWRMIGCRPPACSANFSISQIKSQFKGCVVTVRSIHVEKNKQKEALEWFREHMQGKTYRLAGPERTNCADAVFELGKQADIPEIEKARAKTREEMKKRSGVRAFLKRWNKKSVDEVMNRESIVFPDEFKSAGKYVGKMQF